MPAAKPVRKDYEADLGAESAKQLIYRWQTNQAIEMAKNDALIPADRTSLPGHLTPS
jgi:hypothetical protein